MEGLHDSSSHSNKMHTETGHIYPIVNLVRSIMDATVYNEKLAKRETLNLATERQINYEKFSKCKSSGKMSGSDSPT